MNKKASSLRQCSKKRKAEIDNDNNVDAAADASQPAKRKHVAAMSADAAHNVDCSMTQRRSARLAVATGSNGLAPRRRQHKAGVACNAK